MTEIAMSQPEQADEQFFSAAYQRIIRILLVLLPCLVIAFWIFFNHRFALGFLIGGGVAILNLLSLKKLVIAFADRVIHSGGKERSSGLVLRFVLRYGLVAGVGYAIFKSSAMSAYGLVAGLGIPAAAIMIEAGYELYGAIRQGH
jgi:small-conductance mechanosensitive channel